MKEGWTYKYFEDCLVKAAKAKQVQTSEYNSGSKYPIISQEDKMVSGYCDDDSLLYHIDNPVVIFGDHTRVLKYVDFDFVVGADGVKILIPKEFLKAKFLLYYLRWYQVPSLGYSRHYKLLKEIVLPVPPIAEQERIVAELDLLSGIIEKKKEQLKAYDQLAQSIFYTMFGDLLEANPTKNLKDVASYYIGLTYKPTDVSEQGTIVLRSSNIQNNILDFNDIVRVNLNVGENKTVKDGDILMCARNGSARLVGKVARIRNINEKMSFGAFMTIIRSEYNDFLFHFFLSDFFRSQLTTSKTATINQITSRMLDNIKLNVPPLSLQQEFAEKVEAIERQKALVQQSIEETQTMFDCTMDKYFG